MNNLVLKTKRSDQRKARTRAKVRVLSDRARLNVHRSSKYVYAQIIDDTKGVTLASVRSKNPTEVGEKIAKASIAKKIKKVVFDKGSFKFHGRIKAIAEAARKGGLEF